VCVVRVRDYYINKKTYLTKFLRISVRVWTRRAVLTSDFALRPGLHYSAAPAVA